MQKDIPDKGTRILDWPSGSQQQLIVTRVSKSKHSEDYDFLDLPKCDLQVAQPLTQAIAKVASPEESHWSTASGTTIVDDGVQSDYENSNANRLDDTTSDAIAHQHQAICDLSRDVQQLNEIYQDLGELVQKQDGPIIDIANQVDKSKLHAHHANIDLDAAKQLQKNKGLQVGILATLVGGPVVGVAMGLKFGILTTLFAGSGTYFYKKFI